MNRDVSLVCRAVLFDLDGVLVDSATVVSRTWHRWASRHNLDIPDLVQRAHGRRSLETVLEIAPALDAEAEVRWLAAAELNDADGLRILPGAAVLFDSLSDRHRAVVTSCGRALAEFRLAQVEFSVPAVLIAAEDVASGKPSPDGYVMAARQLAVEASDCVVVEDTPAGIAAGNAAGATVIAVATTFPPDALREAAVVVHSLSDIQAATGEGQVRISITERVHDVREARTSPASAEPTSPE